MNAIQIGITQAMENKGGYSECLIATDSLLTVAASQNLSGERPTLAYDIKF